MVGWAMAQSHGVVPEVPAHRVVNRLGMLSGKHHFDTPERMQQLLEAEGVEVRDDCVQNFAERFWNPSHELGFG
jgi:methylated-DNA-protein-cysteine methyltransferase-like protein